MLTGRQGVSQDGGFLAGEVQRQRTCVGVVAPVDVEAARAVTMGDHGQMLALLSHETVLDADAGQRRGSCARESHLGS